MIKIFIYDIEHQKDIKCLHPFHIGIHDTHYIVDEYENVIAYGDLESMKSRAEWLESNPTPKAYSIEAIKNMEKLLLDEKEEHF